MLTESREDTWHHPGSKSELIFDDEMLQHHLDHITRLLCALVPAAREFAESRKRRRERERKRKPEQIHSKWYISLGVELVSKSLASTLGLR